MKKNFVYVVIAFALLQVLQSCKKDDDAVTDFLPGLTGSWRYVSGIENEKYLLINNDRTCTVLSSDLQGIRDKNDGVLLVTSDQIMIDRSVDQYSTEVAIYNYTIAKDSLKLSKPNEKIALVRDKTAPLASAWVKTVLATVKYKAPISETTDITYDGALLWYGNGYSSNYLYKINPTNGAKDSIATTKYAWSVEAYDNDLWVSSDGSKNVFKVNKATGADLATSADMGAWIYGIAKDNNFLWCYSGNENTLYKYNTTTNTVPISAKVSSNWNGLAFKGSELYVAANGKLHKCSTAPILGNASYELPGYYIVGVAYDGGSFWVSAYKLPEAWPEIIKLSGVE